MWGKLSDLCNPSSSGYRYFTSSWRFSTFLSNSWCLVRWCDSVFYFFQPFAVPECSLVGFSLSRCPSMSTSQRRPQSLVQIRWKSSGCSYGSQHAVPTFGVQSGVAPFLGWQSLCDLAMGSSIAKNWSLFGWNLVFTLKPALHSSLMVKFFDLCCGADDAVREAHSGYEFLAFLRISWYSCRSVFPLIQAATVLWDGEYNLSSTLIVDLILFVSNSMINLCPIVL